MTLADIELALGMVAPFYNLVLALIVLFLFLRFFKMHNRLVYMKPWQIIFAAFCIYLIEETFTVLRSLGIVDFPRIMNGVFEMIIISLFIYTLLLQKDYIQKIEAADHRAAAENKRGQEPQEKPAKRKKPRSSKRQKKKGKKR